MLRFASLLCAVLVAAPAFAVDVSSPPPPRTEGESLYRKGLYPEAIAWWTERAEAGDIEAARRLGIEFMDGKRGVVDRDFGKARKYHLQAAMGGERRSMMDLGTIHENGLGVTADLVEAARWYAWAARYGFGPAQYNYALMLESGEAGRKDEVEAYMWYILAAKTGFADLPEAKFDLNRPPPDSAMGQLYPRLTAAQRAEAMARSKTFRPLSGPLPAGENR